MKTTLHGIELAFEVRGEGEPLVLLHGFGGAGGDWAQVFDLDALEARHKLVVPDLRGHGRSTNTWPEFTHRQCAEDVLGLLDELGVSRAKAIGTSLGGNTLLHMATQAPPRVEAMVVVSATTHIPEEARTIMRQSPLERTEAEWAAMRRVHRHGDAQIRALWQQMRAFADSTTDLAFTRADLAKITARTLVVYGDRDPLYPVEIAVEMYRAIPNGALMVVPNGGHGPIYGDERAAFVAAATAFLR
jgi:pimeloyl-ACP methyl ester carboxylesterase